MAKPRTRSAKREAAPAGEAQAPLRRSEILAIAARHFAEHGYEGTTIRQISDEAGILSGSLYYHFSSKEEIMHELLRPFVDRSILKYREMSSLRDSVDIVAEKLLRMSLEQVSLEFPLHAIITNDRNYFRRAPQFSYVGKLRDEISHIWYGVIQQGMREGVFRSEVNVQLTTTLILKLLSATSDWYDPHNPDSLEAMIQTQQALILNGLRAR
jgi:AcrR family transcriptional regulator